MVMSDLRWYLFLMKVEVGILVYKLKINFNSSFFKGSATCRTILQKGLREIYRI